MQRFWLRQNDGCGGVEWEKLPKSHTRIGNRTKVSGFLDAAWIAEE
jgi:hypothetical protein